MASRIKCKEGSLPFIYLGLPVRSSMKTISDWRAVNEKFSKRLSEWSGRQLSFGGRLTLIKSVLGGLAFYYFSLFRAPATVIQCLERLRKSFFWGGSEKSKYIAWSKWDRVTAPCKVGGLGVGSLRDQNLSLLGKWWWRFREMEGALWVRVIKSIYGEDGGLVQNRLGSVRGHSTWGGIIKLGSELEGLGLRWFSAFGRRIGDGASTSFWRDNWVGEGACLMERFPRLFRLEREKEVRVCERHVLNQNSSSWVWDWLRPPRGRAMGELQLLLEVIRNVSLNASRHDSWIWELEGRNSFSVQALREILEEKRLLRENYSGGDATRWNKLVPNKVSIFVWRALQDRLPARVSLDRRGIDLDSILCPVCGSHPESLEHSLVLCPNAHSIWVDIFKWWGWSSSCPGSLTEILWHQGSSSISPGIRSVWQGVVWAAAYHIWRYRNNVVFKRKCYNKDMILYMIRLSSFNWTVRRGKRRKLQWDVWCAAPVAALSQVQCV